MAVHAVSAQLGSAIPVFVRYAVIQTHVAKYLVRQISLNKVDRRLREY